MGTQHLPHKEKEVTTRDRGACLEPVPPAGAWVPGGRSGAGLRQGVVGPGDRLCVGDSGRLSLEDSEWWRPEEKLRLVCSTDDCLEIFLKRDFLLEGDTKVAVSASPESW